MLLGFAPWVYVGTAPLLVHSHLADRPGGTWVNLPAVVAFTLLFVALAEARRRTGDADAVGSAPFVIAIVAASMMICLVMLLVNAEPLPEMPAAGPGWWVVTAVPVVLLVSVVMAGLAVVVTDRIALQTGTERPAVSRQAAGSTVRAGDRLVRDDQFRLHRESRGDH